jgi:hypothetical protein
MRWLCLICVTMDVLVLSIATETQLEFLSHLKSTRSICFASAAAHPLHPKYSRNAAGSILFPSITVKTWGTPMVKRSVTFHATKGPVLETPGAASSPAALVQAAGSPDEILKAVAELPLPGEEVLHFQLQLHHQRKRLV